MQIATTFPKRNKEKTVNLFFIKVKFQTLAPGLMHNNFVMGFGWAYKWRGSYQGAHNKCFKMGNSIDRLITLFVHGKNSFSTTLKYKISKSA